MSALGGRPRIPRRVLWTQSSLSFLQYAICPYGIKNFSDYLKNKCINEMAQLQRINLNNSLPVFQLNLLPPLVEEPAVGQG